MGSGEHTWVWEDDIRIIDDQRRAQEAHVAEIQAEQEERNAALHEIDHSHIPPLRVAERYALGPQKAKVTDRQRFRRPASYWASTIQ